VDTNKVLMVDLELQIEVVVEVEVRNELLATAVVE
jgi:hypothetical protein